MRDILLGVISYRNRNAYSLLISDERCSYSVGEWLLWVVWTITLTNMKSHWFWNFGRRYCSHSKNILCLTVWGQETLVSTVRILQYGLNIMSLLAEDLCKFSLAGKSGWTAPRLKDAALSLDILHEAWMNVCLNYW